MHTSGTARCGNILIVTIRADLSVTEYAVLGLLGEDSQHGFALSKVLSENGEVGRVMTVRRPLVYRALDRLVEAGLAEPLYTERGTAGGNRIIHRITKKGRRVLARWLREPVAHVRDIRLEFLLKLVLLNRRKASPLALIRQQRQRLGSTLAALEAPSRDDYVGLWRHHSAIATAAYLADLEASHRI
jgi:PadR family transcriptional regulator AphA